MVAQKIVNFVAQDRSTRAIAAIIDLDERTHETAKDAKRGAVLSSGGYRVVRRHSKNKPDAAAIRAEFCPELPFASPV